MSEPKTTTLKCPNCGANVAVGGGRDQFACEYCGASVAVERKGADVSLAAIGEVVAKLTQGSRQSGAELAIKRLTAELGEARADRSRHDAEAAQELAPIDAQIEALGDRQGGLRVVVDTVGVAMPALLWLAIGEHVPLFPVVAAVVAGWWVARHRWRLAGAISSFMYAWAVTYAVAALSLIPFFAMGTEPLPLWLIFTLLGAAVPVALVWSVWRMRRRSAKRTAARDELVAQRAAVAAKFAERDRELTSRVRTLENRIAENKAVADG